MPFRLVSALNRRMRSRSCSCDLNDPWIYKPLECWKLEEQSPSPKKRHGTMVFTFKEMEEATSSFREENLVGKGGFGRVYKGTLRSKEVVAIKQMELPSFKESKGEKEFRVEVDILSRLEHPNLVSLIGYCADGKHRFLVYEFMHNGNLQNNLNGIKESKMEWPLRLKIALGTARGLAYLHSGSAAGCPIVHRDLKSTNILLNARFEAKISDFGLAKFMPEGQESNATTEMLGTFGYLDPEYTLTGKLTLQSDIYAYGVVLLELLTGRQALDEGHTSHNLVLQVRHILNEKKRLRRVIDPEMNRNSYSLESITMFAKLASRCTSIESSKRPTIMECVKELEIITYTNTKALAMRAKF